jgi:hypothetical protein
VTGEPSADPAREPAADSDGESRSQRAASEVAALVAEQVRDAIAVAERSAEEVRRRALDEASAQRDEVHATADQVLARIDELEGRLAQLLRELRNEAMQIVRTVEAPSGSEPGTATAAGPSPAAEPTQPGREEDRAAQPAQAGIPAAEPSAGDGGETWLPPATAGAEDRAAAEQHEPALSWPGRSTGEPDEAASAEPVIPAEPVAEPVAGQMGDEAAEATTRGTEAEPMDWPAEEADAPTASGERADEPRTVVRRRRRGLLRHRRDE